MPKKVRKMTKAEERSLHASIARRWKRENAARAREVLEVLKEQRHRSQIKSGGPVTNIRKADYGTHISDLLADIRHFCDKHALEFHELDRDGYRHYSAEVVQARTGREEI